MGIPVKKTDKGRAFGHYWNVLGKLGLRDGITKKVLIAFMTKHNI